MSNPPRNRRKTFFVALGLVCIPITVGVVWWRYAPSADSPRTFPRAEDTKSPLAHDIRSAASPSSTPEVVREAPVDVPNAKKDSVDIPPTDYPRGTLSPRGPTGLSASGTQIAVVDVERLLAELLPEVASPETRAQTLLDIQQATSRVASARNFDLVVNNSGKSLNEVPFIVSAAGVFDLTEEIRRELTK